MKNQKEKKEKMRTATRLGENKRGGNRDREARGRQKGLLPAICDLAELIERRLERKKKDICSKRKKETGHAVRRSTKIAEQKQSNIYYDGQKVTQFVATVACAAEF